MNKCELCGAIAEGEEEHCQRCGFEFPKAVRSDTRDEKILAKYEGKSIESVRRNLRDKLSYLISYFENVDIDGAAIEDLVTFVEEVLDILQVPLTLDSDDALKFSDREEKLVLVTVSKLEEADISSGTLSSSARSYVRLANSLNCLGMGSKAMELMDKALLKEPNNVDALFGKATFLFYEKKYDESKRYLTKLLSKYETHSKAQYMAEMIDQLINS